MITYPFKLGGPEIRAEGARYIVTQPGGGMILAYADTRDEADEAQALLANIGEAPTFAGITRSEAIELCNGAIARLEALALNRKNGSPFVAGLKNGAKIVLRELATAGAFSDGKNSAELPEVTP